MPAPTALLRNPDALAAESSPDPSTALIQTDSTQEDDAPLTDADFAVTQPDTMAVDATSTAATVDADGRPIFAPEGPSTAAHVTQERSVPVPPQRMTPLRTAWPKIYPPLVQHLKLQVRMNIRKKCVDLRTSPLTTSAGALQQGEDFCRAFMLGFDVDDAIALLRLDDLYIETFEIKDVKTLQGEHLGRAIGRIAGKDGKTKFAIENASRTRVVLADSKIHILGGFKNIHVAREAIVSLILGAPPGKVYSNLRTVASRMKERF